jgi:hypothetical protein
VGELASSVSTIDLGQCAQAPSSGPKNGQIRRPRTDRIRVLARHDPYHLADVPQIVCHPRRKMLPHRHDAELWMASSPIQIRFGQPKRVQRNEVLASEAGEFIQQFVERTASGNLEHRVAIEGRKRDRVAMPKNVLDTRHPVGALAVNQVADDIEG